MWPSVRRGLPRGLKNMRTWLRDTAGARCGAEVPARLHFKALCSRLRWKAQLAWIPVGLGSHCDAQSAWTERKITLLTLTLPQRGGSWAGATNCSHSHPSHVISPPEFFPPFLCSQICSSKPR